MDKLVLLIDGSVNNHSRVGYGAYLIVTEADFSPNFLKTQIKLKRFTQTSSTKLELQTLLWALNDIPTPPNKMIVYSDSQNIVGLPARRQRFEKNDYRSKKNRHLNNYELYQEFFKITDRLPCQFVKIQGHQPSNQKDNIDRLFTLVDKAARKALKNDAQLPKKKV